VTPPRSGALLGWALGDLKSRPAEPLLVGLALAVLLAVAGAGALVTERAAVTYERVLAQGPSLVVHRVDDAGREIPIPEEESLSALRAVPGVVRAEGRVAESSSAPAGTVDEILIDVFHIEEEAAIVPDLQRAVDWPSRIVSREEARTVMLRRASLRGSSIGVALLPAVLAIAALMLGAARARGDRRYEIGLLKTLGWTTADLARLSGLRALIVGLPAAVVGGLLAALFSVGPWSTTAEELVLGSSVLRLEPLDASATALSIAAVTAIVLVPWLAGTLWSVLRSSTADPRDLLDEGAS
jgi:hypothetical protein